MREIFKNSAWTIDQMGLLISPNFFQCLKISHLNSSSSVQYLCPIMNHPCNFHLTLSCKDFALSISSRNGSRSQICFKFFGYWKIFISLQLLFKQIRSTTNPFRITIYEICYMISSVIYALFSRRSWNTKCVMVFLIIVEITFLICPSCVAPL